MALQDLTPQLRTRLSRMERAVGWFVFLATALLLFGFSYYIYHTAQRKGWFTIKAEFYSYLESSAGLNIGDPVVMMGFPIGQITAVDPQQPYAEHNVKVTFEILDPYFRYLWVNGSVVKLNSDGFLGKRQLEVTRATSGPALCVTQPITVFTNLSVLKQLVGAETNEWQLAQHVYDAQSNLVFGAYTVLTVSNLDRIASLNPENLYAFKNTVDRKRIVAVWRDDLHRYDRYRFERSEPVFLKAIEATALGERLDRIVGQVENALPGILSLTNRIAAVLDHTANATSNLNFAILETHPLLTNLADISGQLREPGGLGVWALGTNGNDQVQGALTNLNSLLENTDTNLAAIFIHIADLTSNLNAQVQANTNMLGGISKAVTDADDLMQGLKRHWLLRSAFKVKKIKTTPTKP